MVIIALLDKLQQHLFSTNARWGISVSAGRRLLFNVHPENIPPQKDRANVLIVQLENTALQLNSV